MKIEAVENTEKDDALISRRDSEAQEYILKWSPKENDSGYEFSVPNAEIISGKEYALEEMVRTFILWAENRQLEISDKTWGDFRVWLVGWGAIRHNAKLT